jgi:hypothetical protein
MLLDLTNYFDVSWRVIRKCELEVELYVLFASKKCRMKKKNRLLDPEPSPIQFRDRSRSNLTIPIA